MSDDLYFEPPSRLQLVDKLAHLLRFSNTIVVLSGPSGAGVSTTLTQLHYQIAEDSLYILAVELRENTDLQALLGLLNNKIDELIPTVEDGAADLLSRFHNKIESLTKLKRKILISIDDSELLSDESVQCLLNLIQASENDIGIVLGAKPTLMSKINSFAGDESVLSLIHHEELGSFNRLETEEFIQLQFVRGDDFSNRQLSQIYVKSQGYPGIILQLTNEMIKSGKISLNPKSNILPVPHIIGIALLLTAITTVSSWQYFSDDSLIEEVLVDVDEQPLLGIDQEAGAVDVIAREMVQHSDRAENLKQQISSLTSTIEAQELLIESARDESEVATLADVVPLSDVPAIDEVNQQGRNSVALALNIEEDVALDLDFVERGSRDVQAVARADQLVVAPAVDNTVAQLQLTEPVLVAVKEPQVLLKPKPEKPIQTQVAAPAKRPKTQLDAVVTALPKIALSTQNSQHIVNDAPLRLSETKPLALRFSELTADIQQHIPAQMLEPEALLAPDAVVVEDNSFNKTSVAAPAVIVSKSIAQQAVRTAINKVHAVAAKPTMLNSQSIQAWPSTGYTLQILGSRSMVSVLAFIREMPNSEKMRYFTTTLKGKPWSVVIYGQYATRAAANSAKQALPAKLRQLKPWVKSIKSIQGSINN